MHRTLLLLAMIHISSPLGIIPTAKAQSFELKMEQLIRGPRHHFFGYIGQCQTIPWSGNGRYVLAMEIEQIARMPQPDEAAEICLIDTQRDNALIRLNHTHAWNPQQETMFYWNPDAPDTQFFFNDVDARNIVGQLGTVEIFPSPEGDIALSANASWLANGYKQGNTNRYVLYRLSDAAYALSPGLDKGSYAEDIRIDPAPCWNRDSSAVLVPGIAADGTRQMFVIRVQEKQAMTETTPVPLRWARRAAAGLMSQLSRTYCRHLARSMAPSCHSANQTIQICNTSETVAARVAISQNQSAEVTPTPLNASTRDDAHRTRNHR